MPRPCMEMHVAPPASNPGSSDRLVQDRRPVIHRLNVGEDGTASRMRPLRKSRSSLLIPNAACSCATYTSFLFPPGTRQGPQGCGRGVQHCARGIAQSPHMYLVERGCMQLALCLCRARASSDIRTQRKALPTLSQVFHSIEHRVPSERMRQAGFQIQICMHMLQK